MEYGLVNIDVSLSVFSSRRSQLSKNLPLSLLEINTGYREDIFVLAGQRNST